MTCLTHHHSRFLLFEIQFSFFLIFFVLFLIRIKSSFRKVARCCFCFVSKVFWYLAIVFSVKIRFFALNVINIFCLYENNFFILSFKMNDHELNIVMYNFKNKSQHDVTKSMFMYFDFFNIYNDDLVRNVQDLSF